MSAPSNSDWIQEALDTHILDASLIQKIQRGEQGPHEVIIDLNLFYKHPSASPDAQNANRDLASQQVENLIFDILKDPKFSDPNNPAHQGQGVNTTHARQYCFARLTSDALLELVTRDGRSWAGATVANPSVPATATSPVPARPTERAIYRIWEDFDINPLLTISPRTIKADAAKIAFGAGGKGIVWAVCDSGVEKEHPHFAKHSNLDLPDGLDHRDFTEMRFAASPQEAEENKVATMDAVADNALQKAALKDDAGHGTHVAGIIAGEMESKERAIIAATRQRSAEGTDTDGNRVTYNAVEGIEKISGIAPEARILSLKVLDASGKGKSRSLLAALDYIQSLNNYGRLLRVHGANLSLGYPFDPEWYACGQSPLCVEVNRLVRAGVVVVVAAGNEGYDRNSRANLDLTINDPGNAELAITVGSTHREKPHIYGVSFFSSKGPTSDGRLKPDLLAPGEKILSCAAGNMKARAFNQLSKEANPVDHVDYVESSGTSMAAPHVSGAIAAFLSIRSEFVGRPEEVKAIFLNSATDLKRDRNFQGAGLIDLMRAIQSV